MKALLEVRGLTKHYAGFALENLCFSLVPGRILGLIGANGAGKSTAFRCMLNLSRPDAGSVSMFGRDFTAKKCSASRKLEWFLGMWICIHSNAWKRSPPQFAGFIAIGIRRNTKDGCIALDWKKRKHSVPCPVA